MQLAGPSPPHPPPNLGTAGLHASPVWHRRNDRFLSFVAATQLPWMPKRDALGRETTDGDTVPQERLIVEHWCSELQWRARGTGDASDSLSTRERQIVAEGQLQALDRLSSGLLVGEAAKQMGSFFRMRHRHIWTTLERQEHERKKASLDEDATAAQQLDVPQRSDRPTIERACSYLRGRECKYM